MGEAFSDKEVAFSLCHVIPRRGEDCSFIKLSEWLNAILEHPESAHHRSMTRKEEEARKQEVRESGGRIKKRTTVRFYFQTFQ